MSFTTIKTESPYYFPAKQHDDVYGLRTTKQMAVDFVRALGIRPTLKGYHLLITAICMSAERPYLSHNLTKGLYPCVARYYGISAANVERNIRAAIENAYHTDANQIQALFYYKVGKPYISEVITLALERFRWASYS